MKKLTPTPVSPNNFSAYGKCWQAPDFASFISSNGAAAPDSANTTGTPAPDSAAGMTLSPALTVPIGRPLKLGLTFSFGGNLTCSEMERHNSTEEYLFCGEREMLLAVSNSPTDKPPAARDIRAFVLPPGTVVCLNPGIWHAACRHPHKDTYYYFMAHNNGQSDETRWFPVVPEPVSIEAPATVVSATTAPGHRIFPENGTIFKKRPETSAGDPAAAATVSGNRHQPFFGQEQPFFGQNQHILADLIQFQDDHVCTGSFWKCWMTDDDCLNQPGRLQIHVYPGNRPVHLTHDEENTILFCGNSLLSCQIVEDRIGNILLHPGEVLKLTPHVRQFIITVVPSPDTNTAPSCFWFYTISD